MASNLHGKSILALDNLSPAEIQFLLDMAKELKAAKRGGFEEPKLNGKNIALIFEKDSTRTRSGFEVAAHDQDAGFILDRDEHNAFCGTRLLTYENGASHLKPFIILCPHCFIASDNFLIAQTCAVPPRINPVGRKFSSSKKC